MRCCDAFQFKSHKYGPHELEGSSPRRRFALYDLNDRPDDYDKTKTSNIQDETMIDCCLGAHPKVWYKFKRFEYLSLLNLYYYQHELVSLDAEIFEIPEVPKA